MQDSCRARAAVKSRVASPVPLSGGSPLPSLESRPWPYSCSETPASSPVLAQPPPDLKKLSLEPSQYALQVWFRLTLTSSWEVSQVLEGSQLRPTSLMRLTW